MNKQEIKVTRKWLIGNNICKKALKLFDILHPSGVCSVSELENMFKLIRRLGPGLSIVKIYNGFYLAHGLYGETVCFGRLSS